jgi:hypothetical protein
MEFFETPEEMATQLERARASLKEFEERSDFDTLMTRLRAAHPFHPALLARVFFLVTSVLGLGAAVFVAAITLALDPKQIPPAIQNLDQAVGLPLPVVLGIFALCLGVAYVGATQAALQIARDCALLPAEQRDHDRLLNEVKRLSSQKAIMDRVRGTPMGARPRSSTPGGAVQRGVTPTGAPTRGGSINSMPSYVAPTRAGSTASMPSYIAQPTRPGSLNSQPAMPSRAGSLNSSAGGSPPALSMPTSQLRPERAGTPLGAAPRAGTPVGKLKQEKSLFNPDRVKTLSDEDNIRAPEPMPNMYDIPEMQEDDGFGAAPIKAVPSALQPTRPGAGLASSGGQGFEQRYATHFPQWGAVDDPWLEDAIQKCELLATGFPVQARIWFSPEERMPFALILERATPAMAVRAMVSYVEFLASISTPPKARIVLRSVPHLDRSFHRNVEAALEPYFADKVTVTRKAEMIDITFTTPDPGWNDYPWLPYEVV